MEPAEGIEIKVVPTDKQGVIAEDVSGLTSMSRTDLERVLREADLEGHVDSELRIFVRVDGSVGRLGNEKAPTTEARFRLFLQGLSKSNPPGGSENRAA